jgi:hypothetical protein
MNQPAPINAASSTSRCTCDIRLHTLPSVVAALIYRIRRPNGQFLQL